VVLGTAAQGAVLNTASQAAFRGLKVIIPLDGISAETPYYEQYTAVHLATSPGVGQPAGDPDKNRPDQISMDQKRKGGEQWLK
jgi:nicotinamidase-related amidase